MMLDDIGTVTWKLVRKHFARWGKFEDAIARLSITDNGGVGRLGEQSRRLLDNAECVSNYPSSVIRSLEADRAMTLKELDGPLSAVLGGLVTLELIDERIEGLRRVQKERWENQGDVDRQGYYRQTIPLLEALYDKGVARGAFIALTETEVGAIAQYIMRKGERRLAQTPPLYPNGTDAHAFWTTYALPASGKPDDWRTWLKKQRDWRRRRKA